jgi:hypothetical protein
MALAAVAVIAIAVSSTINGVHAQNQDDDEALAAATPAPYAELQYATLTATTNTVNATMVPVVRTNGTIVYKNLTIPVKVAEDSKGNITITAGTITEAAFPTPATDGFKAGNYAGPGGKSASESQLITIYGPGVTLSGATEWSIATSPGATGCTYPTTATFYVGSLASNPNYARLKKAGITSTAYSYGTTGTQSCNGGLTWQSNTLIGVSQTGNALNIVSFTYDGTDYATPGGQITYVLLP